MHIFWIHPCDSGFLLEISSVLSSIGATVHEGTIQGDKEHTVHAWRGVWVNGCFTFVRQPGPKLLGCVFTC